MGKRKEDINYKFHAINTCCYITWQHLPVPSIYLLIDNINIHTYTKFIEAKG